MAHCSIHPAVQQRLLLGQIAGEAPGAALAYALDLCGVPPGDSALAAMLLACPAASAVLSVAANATGHPCPQGMLLAQLLSSSLLHSSQLLGAVPAADWARAIAGLHAAASSGTLPDTVRGASQGAFAALVKALLTAGAGAERQAERALQVLRQTWTAEAGADGDGAQLLAAAVEVADGHVFPRQLARRWLVAELGRVLAGDADQQPEQGAAATSDAQPGGSAPWDAAMAAFASALPPAPLLQQVQAALRQGRLRCGRAAALLAAAAAVEPAAAEDIRRWASQQAAAALQQRDSAAVIALLHLQRSLLPRLGPRTQQHAQQQQLYAAWLASGLLAPQHRDSLQFLLHGVLLPLLPLDAPCWVQAQAEALGSLLRAARQHPGQLPAACLPLAERYLAQAQQQLQQQQGQRAEGNVNSGAVAGATAAGRVTSPPAPSSSLDKGREIVAGLLAEFGAGGGHLRAATLNAMQAKAANMFTRGELHNMLAPALLEPCGDPAAAAPRAALMRYLYRELGARGDTQIRPHFQPEAVQRYEQLCLRAQLEAATLEQLAQRAPRLLLADAGQPGGGGVSAHQLLDRLGRLVRQHLQRWQEQEQQQQQEPVAPPPGAAVAPGQPPHGPVQLAQLLFSVWSAAYGASLEIAAAGGLTSGASPAVVAAHVLSIAQGAPALHPPLLRCVRQALLRPGAEAGLEAAAMLASAAGALVAQPAAATERQQAPEAGSLRALFVWRLPQPQEGAGQAAEVPGPRWLQGLLGSLPLGGPCGVAGAVRAAAAHLRCARHFSRSSLLPDGSHAHEGAGGAPSLLLHWGQAAAGAVPAADYDGELAASLVFPACPAALRLQQWLTLRLSVARQLLGADLSSCCGSGGAAAPAAAEQRGAKRQRPDTAGAATAAEVLQGCTTCLRSKECAPLAEAAGPLPLSEFLRLEAAAAAAAACPDLLPAGAEDATFRLSCALYLGSSSSGGGGAAAPAAGEEQTPLLGSLVAPLPASWVPRAADVEVIPDSEDEEAAALAAAAAARGASPASSAALEGLAAAVAAVLVPAGGGEHVGALGVCQKACAQVLRLLAARRGPHEGGSPAQPLAALLVSLVQRCKERLSVAAVGAEPRPWGTAGAADVPLRYSDEQQAQRARRQLAALASALALELLPLPLGSAEEARVQQKRLSDLAAAMDSAVALPGGGALPAVLEQLQAVLVV